MATTTCVNDHPAVAPVYGWGNDMKSLHRIGAKCGRACNSRWRTFICMFLLGVGVASVAEAQIGLAGASDADWTVLTVAPDGAWGTSTEGYLNRAIADAIQRCRAMSRSTLGCGAYQVSVQAGWALASRCGRENILAKGATLAEATESARQRELELRRLYQPAMESCRQLVVVAPDGSVKAPEPQAIASDSSRGR